MNETIITGLIAAAVSVMVALTTAAGEKRRGQIEAAKANSDLDLKLKDRVDRIRLQLWEDVEEKMARQAERIVAQDVRIEAQDRRIEKEVDARKSLEIVVEKQAKQIKQLEGELKEKDAIIARLKNGGSDYTPASL